jgi:Flp pilus assembly protein CpaB
VRLLPTRLTGASRLARRLRILLATRPLAYWSLTALVAVATGAAIHAITAAAVDARHQWGDTRPALVATRTIAAGEVLDATAVDVRPIPLALVPDGALGALPAPGTPAAAPIGRGEIVSASRIGRGGRSEVAALLPEGTRGVGVPVTEGVVPLRAGDVVDVVAADLVVPAAAVVRVGDGDAVVAVPAGDAPAVARAVAAGQVTLVLSP